MSDVAQTLIAVLESVRDRDGANAAGQVARHMIATAAAWIADEEGPDEARRILHVAGITQGESS
jgi:hypothetical protein